MSTLQRTTLKWQTKDGTIIRIVDMEDSHLINTIKMLQRKASMLQMIEELKHCLISDGANGEMAREAIDDEFNRIADLTPEEYLNLYMPEYKEMVRIAILRGLTI